MANEFQVKAGCLGDYALPLPFGWIGVEVPPPGVSEEKYPETAEFKEGKRHIQFGRPFRPNLASEVVVTGGIWIPDRLLVCANPAIAR